MTGTKPVPDYDPGVKIPAAVLAASAHADKLFREANGIAEPGEEPPAEPDPEPTPPAAAAPVPEPPKPAEKPLTSQGNDEASWEHRYNSMKGRYDRSQEQLRSLSEQVSSLQQMVVELQSKASAPPPELRAERLITPEEEKDYGSEFLTVVGKKAKEELSPEVAALKQQIADLNTKLQGVGGFVQQDARARMLSVMDERLPGWREVNVNDAFKDWLALPDTYSGAIRHDLLKAAFERNDGPRVLAFFQGFLAEEAAVAPANAEPDRQAEAPKVPLESLAAPGRAKTAAANSAPAEKPSFTRAQIAKFYADVGAGKYRGRDAEKDKLERQIFDAQREGRIR